MKKYMLTLVSVILLCGTEINYSQDNGFGLGIIIGEPTGISGKYWIDGNHALDFGLGWSFGGHNNRFSFHGDYLYHIHNLIQSNQRMPVYYGFGLRLRAKEHSNGSFGVRGVIGIAWLSYDLPLDVFIEAAPVFTLLPDTDLELDLGLGARYYFK